VPFKQNNFLYKDKRVIQIIRDTLGKSTKCNVKFVVPFFLINIDFNAFEYKNYLNCLIQFVKPIRSPHVANGR